MSSIFEFLTRLLDFITGIFSSRKEDKANLWSEILDCRAQLSVALAEGRITDVRELRLRLDSLMKQYSRRLRKYESDVRKARRGNPGAFLFLAVMALMLAGCASTGKKKPVEVLVIGERINVLKPGTTVQVPELVKPARMWYLLDDVAIQQWLGIPVNYSEK